MTYIGENRRWGALGRATLFMLLCAVLVAVVSPLVKEAPGKWRELVTGALAGSATLLLTVLFTRWERLRLSEVGVAPDGHSPVRLLAGFAIGIFLVALWAGLSVAAGHVRWVRDPAGHAGAAAVALIGFGALAWREELAFRGFPLRVLDRSFGLWPAQILVAAVFVAEHRLGGMTWTDALFGSGTGALLFGLAAIATRGLAVPLGIHSAWNFGQWTLGLKGGPGLWRAVPGSGDQSTARLTGMVLYVAVAGSAALGFWLWLRFRAAREVRL
jgi:membrane protease YdiL (CAAX protease family)